MRMYGIPMSFALVELTVISSRTCFGLFLNIPVMEDFWDRDGAVLSDIFKGSGLASQETLSDALGGSVG